MVCMNDCFYACSKINSYNGSNDCSSKNMYCSILYTLHCLFPARAVFLARMRGEWARLRAEEKQQFKKEAMSCRGQLPQDEGQKTAYLRRVCSELNQLTDFMKQLGWSFFYKITTETSILESPGGQAASVQQNPTPPPTRIPRPPKGAKEEERANLRREVQNLFNELYGQATGSMGNFPYKKHKICPEVAVTGLPEGVPFKEPFSYGLPALKAIIAEKHKIQMHLIQASLSEDVAPGEDTTPAIRAQSLWQQLTGSCAAVSSQRNGSVSVVAKVTHLDATSPGTEDCVAPTPHESTHAPGNVHEVLPTFSPNVDTSGVPDANNEHEVRPTFSPNVDTSGVPDANNEHEVRPTFIPNVDTSGVPDANNEHEVRPTFSPNVDTSGVPDANAMSTGPEKTAEKSSTNGAVKKSQWKAEEVAAVQLHFQEELEGRKLVQMANIKKFVVMTNFSRTPSAVQKFLLRRRKEHRTQ
ncbi:uncharacterized protein LOC112557917 isoform X2 [Pomacea canaliculata]|uniref:uncharacterized protein LOC112557917 isoform X2 n=1 Tax=Pomacea canaliculata TaxID=400727 RepID=UPI000D72E532|nr:uncharacterized protein LOC112557917 isoform X2 [Pomacea canaliculata]